MVGSMPVSGRAVVLVYAWLVASFPVWHSSALAQPPEDPKPAYSQEQLAFFETKIRPVLVHKCYSCHSQEAVKNGKLKGNLLLDSKEGLLTGGDTGPALVPNEPEASLLLKALRYQDYEMPPSGK